MSAAGRLAAVALAAAVAAAVVPAEVPMTSEWARGELERARKGGRDQLFLRPDDAALGTFRELVRAWAAGAKDFPTAPLERCGFAASSGPGGLTCLHEGPGRRGGGGAYLLARSPATARLLVLQAPHSFFDKRTGEIALALFERLHPAALFVNTVHRKNPSADALPDFPADVAHNRRNFFHAATEGMAAALPGVVFVQIHGFDAARRSRDSKDFDFILADGTGGMKPDSLLSRAAVAFRAEFGDARVAVHGSETRELGATTNAQGAYLNGLAPGRFLHVETAAAERDKLAKDGAELAKLAGALERLLK